MNSVSNSTISLKISRNTSQNQIVPSILTNTVQDEPSVEVQRQKYSRLSRPYPRSEFLRAFYNTCAYFLLSYSPVHKTNRKRSGKDGTAKSFYFFKKAHWSLVIVVVVMQSWSILAYLLTSVYFGQKSSYNRWDEDTLFTKSFQAFLNFCWFVTIVNFFETCRTKGQGFSDILNKINGICIYLDSVAIKGKRKALPKSKFAKLITRIKTRLETNVYNTLTPVMLLLLFIWAAYTRYLNIIEDTPPYFNMTAGAMIRQQVCGLPIEDCKKDSGLDGFPTGYIIFAVSLVIGGIMSDVAAHLWEIASLFHSILFFMIVRDFTQFLKNCEKDEGQGCPVYRRHIALNIFEEICSLSDLMDETMGSVIAYSCLGIITYYANLINMVSELQWIILIQVGLYAVVQGSFLFLAGETNSRLSYLVFWLQRIGKSKSPVPDNDPTLTIQSGFFDFNIMHVPRISLALNQLERNQIGIRGRVFTVTYNFVGSMLSLLLSYSILISQQNGGSEDVPHLQRNSTME